MTDDELRTAETQILVDRFNWARQMGMTFNGARNLYAVLGYDDIITAQQYRNRYARGGIAGRVVDALAKAVWRGDGDIYEDEDPTKITEFEKQWDLLNEQLNVWSTLQRAHILASLGSYSVILLGAPGDLSLELPKGKPGGIVYLTPFGGGVIDAKAQRGQAGGTGADVTIRNWDETPSSPRFGQPLTYQLKRVNFSTPNLEKPVHWSRVIHVPAPGFLDDAIFGPPALESVWNYLDDLDKVVGGGAEAFWLRANAGVQFNVDRKMTTLPSADELKDLKAQAEAYQHQLTRLLRTRGVDVNQLGSDVANFKDPSDAIVTLIAGTCGIPKRILTGSEMGELASGQDRDNWNDQIKDCRTSYAHPVVLRQFIERLILYGYLTKPVQWMPQWPDDDAMSEPEKIDAAKKAAEANDHGQIVITGNEIREKYLDLKPLSDAEIAAARPPTPPTFGAAPGANVVPPADQNAGNGA